MATARAPMLRDRMGRAVETLELTVCPWAQPPEKKMPETRKPLKVMSKPLSPQSTRAAFQLKQLWKAAWPRPLAIGEGGQDHEVNSLVFSTYSWPTLCPL